MFSRIWNHFKTSIDDKLNKSENNVDPKVLLDRKMREFNTRYLKIKEHAAKALGAPIAIGIKITREYERCENIKASTMQALNMVENAKTDEDRAKFESQAEILAIELSNSERELHSLKESYETAVKSAEFAKQHLDSTCLQMKEVITQKNEISRRIDTAELNRTLADNLEAMSSEIGIDSPSFAEIETKADEMFALSRGKMELYENSPGGVMKLIDAQVVKEKSQKRLDSLRSEMRGELTTGIDTLQLNESVTVDSIATPNVVEELA